MRLLGFMAIPCFYIGPPISIANVRKLSKNYECLAEKVIESVSFPLFYPEFVQNIGEKL